MSKPTYSTLELNRFVSFLKEHAVGSDSAKTARSISQLIGLDDRKLRVLAHAANQSGIIICSDNRGYFLPQSYSDVTYTIGRLRSQAREMNQRADVLEYTARQKFSVSSKRTEHTTTNQQELPFAA